MKVMICGTGFPDASRTLCELLPEHEVFTCPADEVGEYAAGMDVLIPTMTRIGEPLLRHPRIGLVQQYGVGLEGVDIETATRLGVWVARVPSAGTGNADSVAEHAIMLLLALVRNLDRARNSVRAGRWGQPVGVSFLGKTACIVGFGDIGVELARRLAPFGLRLTGVRQRVNAPLPEGVRVDRMYSADQLPEALAEADFVILAVKYDRAQNHHLFNDATLAAMKPGSYLVNVARGGLVDTDALCEALRSGHVAGAGLDVFEQEPPNPEHPIFYQNVICTPHIAGVTDISYRAMGEVVAENIRRYARGEAPLHAANSPARPRGAFVCA